MIAEPLTNTRRLSPEQRAMLAHVDPASRMKVCMLLTNMSRQDIVKETGISYPVVRDAVNGTARTLRTARGFADLFGVAVDDLFPNR